MVYDVVKCKTRPVSWQGCNLQQHKMFGYFDRTSTKATLRGLAWPPIGGLPTVPKTQTAPEPQPAKTRRRAPGADPEVRSFGLERTCAADGCETQLSRYNPDSYCSVHRGWDRQVVTRRRRARESG